MGAVATGDIAEPAETTAFATSTPIQSSFFAPVCRHTRKRNARTKAPSPAFKRSRAALVIRFTPSPTAPAPQATRVQGASNPASLENPLSPRAPPISHFGRNRSEKHP